MKETKIYADEFCTTFASTTEMLEFLAERAKQSKWIRKPTRMLKLVPLEKEAETIEEACEKELEGIVEDTEKNTQLVLKVNKDFYPVRDCAIHTILKRAGINGTGLKKLEKATYAKVVNYCLQVAKGDALIKVADGKVSAVHGGDDHDYCVLDMQTIFNMTSDYLKAHFKGNTIGGVTGTGQMTNPVMSPATGSVPVMQQMPSKPQFLDPNMPVEELVKWMSYEQAIQVAVTGQGKFSGKTMGQVAIESPSSLQWFAEQYHGQNHFIPAAARVILAKA
ncbi:hypothetical protein [Dorea longicatena]|uniref:hypothetical protein n=1 Tax=Dorea longicatena TaxID=88431 RepID=UPI001FBBD83F|nr:hypothetical protein [Dorea longicatena]